MDSQTSSLPHGHRETSPKRSPQLDHLRANFLLLELSYCIWDRFEETGDQQDLDWSIALERLLFDAWPRDSPFRLHLLDNLANSRSVRYERWKRSADLDRCDANGIGGVALGALQTSGNRGILKDLNEVIELEHTIVSLLPDGHPDRLASLGNLAAHILTRFEQIGGENDLEESITLICAVLHTLPKGHPDRVKAINNLANCNQDDLDEAVRLHREALPLHPNGHPNRSSSLNNLANAVLTRFRQNSSMDDLEEAIGLYQEALSLHPNGSPGRSLSLGNLASSLLARFERNGDMDDLEQCVRLHRQVLSLRPKGHPGRSSSLGNLASAVLTRFEQNGDTEDLDEAVRLYREALSLHPDGHPDRPSSLSNLANGLLTRFRQTGNQDDLDEAVRLYREALSLRPDGNPDLSSSLNNLANGLLTRFQQMGNEDDLDEAVRLHREALSLHPSGHPNRSSSLNDLANAVIARFKESGSMDDLEEAISLYREALSLDPNGSPGRPSTLSNLANGVLTRFEQNGDMDDLEQCVRLNREALSLRPNKHPERPSSLSNLANAVLTRFKQNGDMGDLDEALSLHREVISIYPNGHPNRSSSLNDLANVLLARFKEIGSVDDLEEAIGLYQEALSLHPNGYPSRPSSLSNLATCVLTRFEQNGDMEDLDEAVRLFRKALSLRPKGHPDRTSSLSNLANAVLTRFEQSGDMENLDEAILLYRESLSLCPEGHPFRSSSLFNAASALHDHFSKTGHAEDFEEGILFLRQAADHPFSPILVRLSASQQWARSARRRDHSTTLDAYRTAMSLLQRALTNRPALAARHDLLTSEQRYQTLAVDAASYAVEKGDFGAAIELLEQGRALLWSQMRGLRTPLARLEEADESLAGRFKQVSNQLESLMTSSEGRSVGSGPEDGPALTRTSDRRLDDERMERVRRLTAEQEALIGAIRKLPGFEDFLQAVPFEKLRQVASEGPVVVIIRSEFRCDGLIILPREDRPCLCVPLDNAWFSDSRDFCNDLLRARYEVGVHSLEYDEALRRAMKITWDRVASKVVQQLDECGFPKGSRIWWCPTQFLSMLPFHAAGPYEDANGHKKHLIDDYISSYTPTLTSLIAARTGPSAVKERLLFVGDTSLEFAETELGVVRTHRHGRATKSLLDNEASSDSVTKLLQKVEWVHFACHGSLDLEKPFESSFELPGGNLTLLNIAASNLPNAEFAFLAACHTAEVAPVSKSLSLIL